jgi:uncharacterized protein (TIGR02145 family)
MNKLLLLIAVFCALKAHAQNYLITFAATGATTSLASVKVENLMAGTSLTLNGSDILRLNVIEGISQVENGKSSTLRIYPNPMTDKSVLQIYPPVAGEAFISVLDMSGKLVFKIPAYLENHSQEFNLSGLKSGFYLISVKGNNYQYSGKLLSNSKESGTINLEKISNNKAVEEKNTKTDSKGVQATVDMAYTTGDRLKFTGTFEKYSTVKMDIPTSSKSIIFNFIPCRDEDNNLYSIVEIGTQVWMAENLKTTKYNDGIIIPLVTDNTAWSILTTPGYCWYNNDENSHKQYYGALYNWYAVNTGKLCPDGWHVPTDAEWIILITYLGGESVAGGKLKENTTWWWQPPNAGATNETGFTALPGGYRPDDNGGIFTYIGIGGSWWCSTEISSSWAHSLTIFESSGGVEYYQSGSSKGWGLSIRCIKD